MDDGMKHICCLLAAMVLLFLCSGCSTKETAELPADPVVAKLILAQEAAKVNYVEGETFDPTGLIVNAKMSDGTVVENVPFTLEVDTPLTRTTLFAVMRYEGKTVNQQLRITLLGNDEQYSAANMQYVPGSALEGKLFYWLGSSVTYGASACGESMADFLAKRDGAVCIKEAVSGTTLADVKKESYVQRFNSYLLSEECAEHVDAFICQLSTNDRNMPESFGTVSGEQVREPEAFDCAMTFGAIEYIIAKVQEVWGCPVLFYVNPPLDENYETMVNGLEQIAQKWGIQIVDMYHDAAFNQLTEEQRSLYMADAIHPTRAGYRDWWLPKFEEALELAVKP